MIWLVFLAAFMLPSVVSDKPSGAQKAGGRLIWVILAVVGIAVLSGHR